MAKINIVMGDTDELYLNSIVNYVIEHTNTFEVQSFTIKESLLRYIGNKANKVDIIAVSEDMADESILKSSIPAKVLLSDGFSHSDIDGYDIVNKYQKAEGFINQILMIYAEKTGRMDAVVTGNKSTVVVGFYSPVGGSGKTTLSLAASAALAKKGKRVIYLNFEKISSTAGLLERVPAGSMSDVYLTKKTKGANVGLKIMTVKQQYPIAGFNCINPSESSLELNELSPDEIAGLIKDFDSLGEFDYVIIDFDGEFSNEKITELAACDKIIAPFVPEQTSVAKMSAFLNEISIHEELAELRNKLAVIVNKFLPNGPTAQPMDFEASAAVAMSPIFADIRSVVSSPDAVAASLEGLVSLL